MKLDHKEKKKIEVDLKAWNNFYEIFGTFFFWRIKQNSKKLRELFKMICNSLEENI